MGNKHSSRADHKLRDLNRDVGSVAEINRLEYRDSLVGRLKALVDHAPESTESLGIVHTKAAPVPALWCAMVLTYSRLAIHYPVIS